MKRIANLLTITVLLGLSVSTAAAQPSKDNPSGEPARIKTTVHQTPRPNAGPSRREIKPKGEAITVSVTPFLTSAEPHPLTRVPERKAGNQRPKGKSTSR